MRILITLFLLPILFSSCAKVQETYKYYNMYPIFLTGDPNSVSYAGSNFYKKGEEHYQPDIFIGIGLAGDF